MQTYTFQDRVFQVRNTRQAARSINFWSASELITDLDFWPTPYTEEIPGTQARTQAEAVKLLVKHIQSTKTAA